MGAVVQPGLEPFSTSNKTGEESEVEKPGPRGKKKQPTNNINIEHQRETTGQLSALRARCYCFKSWGINSTYLFKACQLAA